MTNTIISLINTKNNRRQFIESSGKSLLAATVLGQLAGMETASAQQATPVKDAPDPAPVVLSPIDHPTEQEKPSFFTPLNPARKVGFAIVGLGRLSLGELLPAFGECKYAKPVAVVSGDAAKAAKVADQYGIPASGIYNYQNFDSIKDNPAVEVVYIVLPNSMHEEFTIRAAKAGKHVLCEKPMANSSAEAQRMIDACNKANVKLMIAYRIQYEPANTMAKEWVRSSKYGKVKMIEMYNGQHIGDPAQWRLKRSLAGGGALPDIGLYCLNTARFLTGEEPEWVMASQYSTPGDERFKEVEETVMFQLRFPGGTLVNATTTYGAHQSRRYRCLTDKGAYFGLDPAFAYNGLKAELETTEGKMAWKQQPVQPEQNQFALEMDHMADCVRQNRRPYTPGEEGLQDHRVMEAIYRSAKEGKPVQLERMSRLDAFRGEAPRKSE
jgi:predicted dehydrogenase